jgi:DpnII restriction endonuclease
MRVIAQTIEDIVTTLRPLTVEWKDAVAQRVIEKIEAMPVKPSYTQADVTAFLDDHFDDGLLICRLFLGLSADQFRGMLAGALGEKGAGVTRYRKDRAGFLEGLLSLGILEAMTAEASRTPRWSDVLVERLRSGRGSAISGQRRGRGVEEFAIAVVQKVFGDRFAVRCNFSGARNKTAKCDVAIPSRTTPRILIEAKGYGATGSKMTDIIGDIEKIIAAKRADTAFLFFTDGVTWKQRRSDLRKIVEYQNNGDITRIYTYAMAEAFEADLQQLKAECGL